jgi:cobalt-zinc-cadmium efflux system outer membrane protein
MSSRRRFSAFVCSGLLAAQAASVLAGEARLFPRLRHALTPSRSFSQPLPGEDQPAVLIAPLAEEQFEMAEIVGPAAQRPIAQHGTPPVSTRTVAARPQTGDLQPATVDAMPTIDTRIQHPVDSARPFPGVFARPGGSEILPVAAMYAEPVLAPELVEYTDAEVNESVVAPVPLASDAADIGYGLDYFEQTALANNPTLSQLSASVQVVNGVRRQVQAYPNPTLGYSAQQLADRQTDQHTAVIQQQIVLGDKLRLNGQVLGHAANAQAWEVESQRYRVLTDVRTQFYAALTAQRRLDLFAEFERVADDGVNTAEARLEGLIAARTELLQSQIQRTEVQTQRQQAEYTLRAAWESLTAVSGTPGLSRYRLTGELRPEQLQRDWDATYQSLLASSPELQGARARVQQARANICRQQAQPIPNLDLELGAGYDNSTQNGMLNFQIGAPIPVFNRNDGNIRAAYAEHCRAVQDVRRIELALKSRLAEAAREFDAAAIAVINYERDILQNAQDTLDLTTTAYAVGEADFLSVLIARRTYFETNLNYIAALGEVAQAEAQLDGFLLTGGLDATTDPGIDDGLRGQALDGQ